MPSAPRRKDAPQPSSMSTNSRLWPARVGDPFNTDLLLRNLASIVGNYADAGADLLVLAWHIDRAPELVAIQDRGLQLPVVDASGSLSEIVDAVLGLLT